MKELFYDPSNFARVSFVMRKKGRELSDRLDRANAHFNSRSSVARRFKGLRVSHFRYPASLQLTLSRFLPEHISVPESPAGSLS